MKPIVLKHLFYLFIHALIILTVTLNFKFITDRPTAALLAGMCFFIGQSIIIWLSRKSIGWTLIAHSIYMIIFVIPMMAVRLSNWGVDFNELSIWGLTGDRFHKLSSMGYNVLFVAILRDLVVRVIEYKRSHHVESPKTNM